MYLAFYKGQGKVGNAIIRAWEGGVYSHVELVMSTAPDWSQPVLCASSSMMDGGVRFKRMRLDAAKWDVVSVPRIDRERAVQWFARHAGQRYDYLGLMGTCTPLGQHRTRWTCCEAVKAAMGVARPGHGGLNALAYWCLWMGQTVSLDQLNSPK